MDRTLALIFGSIGFLWVLTPFVRYLLVNTPEKIVFTIGVPLFYISTIYLLTRA